MEPHKVFSMQAYIDKGGYYNITTYFSKNAPSEVKNFPGVDKKKHESFISFGIKNLKTKEEPIFLLPFSPQEEPPFTFSYVTFRDPLLRACSGL